MDERALGQLIEAIEAADAALFRVINLATNSFPGGEAVDRLAVARGIAWLRNQLSRYTETPQATQIEATGEIRYPSVDLGMTEGALALRRLKGYRVDD